MVNFVCHCQLWAWYCFFRHLKIYVVKKCIKYEVVNSKGQKMLVTVKLFVKIFLTNKSNRFTNNNRNRRYSKLIQFMKAITYYYPCYILQNFPTINSHDITKILLKVALNTHNHQLSLLLFALTKTTIWLTSNLSFAPLYQYVIGGPVGTPVWVTYWVTLCTIQSKWWLRDYESVTKLLCLLWAIWLIQMS